ncbi:MAG: hypothetical protein GY930_09410 [bacterium]|nr:hypothetical protein [bacterium]
MLPPPTRVRNLLAMLVVALAVWELQPMAQASASQTGPAKLVDFEPTQQRESDSEDPLITGVVKWPAEVTPNGTFQVFATLSTPGQPKVERVLETDQEGRFLFHVPKGTAQVSFRADHELFGCSLGHRWFASQPRALELHATAKHHFVLQAALDSGESVEGARFWQLPTGGDLKEIEGTTDSNGRLELRLDYMHAGGYLYGVSPQGRVAGPIMLMPGDAVIQPVVFHEPARVRIPLSKKYPYTSGSLKVRFSFPPGRDTGIRYWAHLTLAPGDFGPDAAPFEFQPGTHEFLVPPGHAWNLGFDLNPEWKATLKLPKLDPGQVFDAPAVVLDPGPAVRGRVIDDAGLPVSNTLVRGLAGWNPKKIDLWPRDESLWRAGDDMETFTRRMGHRETRTDPDGRFYIPTHSRILSVPLEIHLPALPGTEPVENGVRQHFEKVTSTGEEVTLVLAPEPVLFEGLVQDPQGQSLKDFTLRIEPENQKLTMDYDTFICSEEEALTWYEAQFPSFRGDLIFDSNDGFILGPPYSPASEFPMSGPDGRFQINVLPKGTYSVTVITDEWHEQKWTGIGLPLPEPLTLELKPSATLEVRIRSSENSPVAGIKVQFRGPLTDHTNSSFESCAGILTQESSDLGLVSFEGLAPGRYELLSPAQEIHYLVARHVQIKAGERHEEFWTAFSRGRFSGQIKWPAEELQVRVALIWKGPSDEKYQRTRGWHSALATSETFQWGDLREGPYELVFSLTGARDGLESILPTSPVTISPGKLTQHLIHPAADVRILKGHVKVNGKPASEGTLRVMTCGRPYSLGRYKIGRDGVFEVPTIGTGEVHLQYMQVINPGSTREETIGAQTIQLPTEIGTQTELNFSHSDLRIWLVDEYGLPLDIPERAQRAFTLQPVETDNTWKGRTAWHQGDHLLFPSMPAGSYNLPKTTSAKDFPWGLSDNVPIRLDGVNSAKETVTLQARFEIKGQVLCPNWPERVPVEVTAWADAAATQKVQTTRAGIPGHSTFTLRSLPPGPVWLTVAEMEWGRHRRSAKKTSAQGPFNPRELLNSRIELTIDWPGTPEPRPVPDAGSPIRLLRRLHLVEHYRRSAKIW